MLPVACDPAPAGFARRRSAISVRELRSPLQRDLTCPPLGSCDFRPLQPAGTNNMNKDEQHKIELAVTATLELIDTARASLLDAAVTCCPLRGWSRLETLIGEASDEVKRLWCVVKTSPRPTGYGNE